MGVLLLKGEAMNNTSLCVTFLLLYVSRYVKQRAGFDVRVAINALVQDIIL